MIRMKSKEIFLLGQDPIIHVIKLQKKGSLAISKLQKY